MDNENNSLKAFDNFVVDTNKKVLWCENAPVRLPLKAIEMLCILIEHNGEVVSKEDLLDRVWQDSFVEEGILSQNVYRLRKAFKKYGNEVDLIQTIPSRGYRFSGEIMEVIEEELSIERSTFEKKFIVEKYTSDEEHSQVNSLPRDISTEVSAKQIPNITSRISFGKNSLIYLGIILLAFSVIGAGVWFWKSPNSGRNRFGLIKDNLEHTRITDSGKAFSPAISRDNQHLAYIRSEKNKYSIILQNIATKSETVVIEPKDFEMMSLNFSADGNYLFYITREKENPESTIYQIPIYGGTRRKIITNIRHYFSLSPDGDQFAFFRYNPKEDETYLMTCRIDGSDERIIANRKHPNFFSVWGTYPAWAPDGSKIVVVGIAHPLDEKGGQIKNSVVEINIKTGKEKLLQHPEWKSVYQAFWHRDGKALVVSAREGLNRQLWHLSYPDGKATRITNDTNDYRDFKLSFDTNSIFVVNKSQFYNLFTISLEDRSEIRQLTNQTLATFGLWGMDWTKDGKHIVYVKSEGIADGNLWKMNLETLKSEQITFDINLQNRYPNITPDGKSVVFSSNRAGNRDIWQIDLDGKNLQQITNLKKVANYPEISKDGKWLFYHIPGVGSPELWKKPLKGGTPEKILVNAGGHSRVSPIDSSKIIAYHYDPNEEKKPWKYVLFSHDSKGELRQLNFDSQDHSFEWNNDGTGVYFPNKSRSQNNLWYLPIKENKAKQITNFSDQIIINLSLSPAGKTIAFSRGISTSNIVKISSFQQN